MDQLTLKKAQDIIAGAFDKAASMSLAPLGVAVLDARGALKCYAAQDGTSLLRFQIAFGKAYGAIGMGLGGAELFRRVRERPTFLQSVASLDGVSMIPARGGVLICDGQSIIGAVGISGDHAENDEACAIAGIEAVGFVADAG